jgi:hypothetical protein
LSINSSSARSGASRLASILTAKTPREKHQTAQSDTEQQSHYEVRRVIRFPCAIEQSLKHYAQRGKSAAKHEKKSVVEGFAQKHCLFSCSVC